MIFTMLNKNCEIYIDASCHYYLVPGLVMCATEGASRDDILIGGAGADLLPGLEGNDTLIGGDASATVGDQTLPTVVSRPDGGFTVTWQSTVTGSPRLESRTFANAASPLWVAGTTINDTLTGGVGTDAFRYEGSTNGWDTITDLQSGTDRIEVVGVAFGRLAAGALDPAHFALNAAADADDRFVFNTTTRILSYDAGGSGVGTAVSLAYLPAGTGGGGAPPVHPSKSSERPSGQADARDRPRCFSGFAIRAR